MNKPSYRLGNLLNNSSQDRGIISALEIVPRDHRGERTYDNDGCPCEKDCPKDCTCVGHRSCDPDCNCNDHRFM